MSHTKSVLILTVGKNETVKAFARGLEIANPRLQITLAAYYELDYFLDPKGSSFRLHESGKDISQFDVVHIKSTPNYLDVAAGIARYLDKRNTPFASRAVMDFSSTSKFYQYTVLCDNNVPVPSSIFLLTRRLSQSFNLLVENLGLPFILKDIYGTKGKLNFLIQSEQDFMKVAKTSTEDNLRLIAQKFIPNDSDYRILVLGQEIDMVIRRIGSKGTHLNNVSQGSAAELIDKTKLPKDVLATSLKAAKLLGREIAGVDMVEDSLTGAWYCFEVNNEPQLATGSFKQEKVNVFADFLEKFLEENS